MLHGVSRLSYQGNIGTPLTACAQARNKSHHHGDGGEDREEHFILGGDVRLSCTQCSHNLPTNRTTHFQGWYGNLTFNSTLIISTTMYGEEKKKNSNKINWGNHSLTELERLFAVF